MSRLGRWCVTVATMVTVATVLLLVTGWGSALGATVTAVFVTNKPTHPIPVAETNTDADGNIKVHEEGTASVAQSGTWNVGITGTPTVKSGDVASVLDQGANVTINPGQRLTLNPDAEDVSAYREVTVFLAFTGGNGPVDTQLNAFTDDGTAFLFAFDSFAPPENKLVKTYDPAPAKLLLQVWNNSTTSSTTLDYTVIGRTN